MKNSISLIFSLVAFPIFGSEKIVKLTQDVRLIIRKGDITHCPAEAIVNAANAQLLGGAGVCGAIFKAAGWDALQDACNAYPLIDGIRCKVGQACATDSFQLHARNIKHIIHAVGPDCRVITNESEQDRLLRDAYKNSLICADNLGVSSIAFPFISSAIYAFPKQRASTIALRSIAEYVREQKTNLKTIYIVLFSGEDFDLFRTNSSELTGTHEAKSFFARIYAALKSFFARLRLARA